MSEIEGKISKESKFTYRKTNKTIELHSIELSSFVDPRNRAPFMQRQI